MEAFPKDHGPLRPRIRPARWSSSGSRGFALSVVTAMSLSRHGLPAQSPKEPESYTVEVRFSGDSETTVTHYRLGQRVLVEEPDPREGADHRVSTVKRTLYDLATHRSLSWNPRDLTQPCIRSNFVSEDLEDPFDGRPDQTDDEIKHLGKQRIHGFSAEGFASEDKEGPRIEMWVDLKTGLVLKVDLADRQSGQRTHWYEATRVTLAPPPASIFSVPANCASFELTPETERWPDGRMRPGALGKLTWNAVVGPPGKDHCTALFRITPSATGKTLIGGFQVAEDLATADPLPHYSVRLEDDGRALFSGGALREIEPEGPYGIFRLPDVPEQFVLDVEFGRNGSASARIYRHCFGSETLLQFQVSDTDDIRKGGFWEWVQAGMYPHFPH
jgi:hypothetical protein